MHLSNKLKLNLLTLLLPLAAAGQGDTYIAPGATIYYFGNTAIYGNMQNNGNLGTIANDTVTFYGTNWVNSSSATFPKVGAGGTISFVQPRPAPFGGSVTQTLDGGYSSGAQPSFPHLNINNPNNVSLVNTNTRVTDNLNFVGGKVVMNARDLVMGSAGGSGGTGTITGYDQNRYVVSNNNAGHLVKESYTGVYTFPVGKGTAGTTDYAPAKITNATANAIHANVRDYASTSGSAPRPTNTGVDRMWNIYADAAGGSTAIDLQHDTSSNQAGFRNASHFVTRYVGIAPNSAGDQPSIDAWERNTPGPGTMPGTLTTGAPIVTASERARNYVSLATSATQNQAFYTKASGPLCINARAYLEGALTNNGGAIAPGGRPLMRDNLRNSPFTGLNYIPKADPYETPTDFVDVTASYTKLAPQTTFPQFQQVTDSATVFGVSGQNAIVDWVFVQLRSKSSATTVAATRAALVQRDGDIVEVDGQSCLSFPNVAIDSYYVSVRHRSHLGTMTKYAQSATNLETLVDFTVPTTPLYDKGTVGFNNYTGLAQNDNVIPGYRAMWQGDFNADGKVKYDSPDDDLSTMLFDVLAHPNNVNGSTNYDFAYGYRQGDFDMNSKTKFDSPDDDNASLLFQVLAYPQNVNGSTNYDFMIQQLP